MFTTISLAFSSLLLTAFSSDQQLYLAMLFFDTSCVNEELFQVAGVALFRRYNV